MNIQYEQMRRDFSHLELSDSSFAVFYDSDDDMVFFIMDTRLPVEEYVHTRFIAGLDEFGCVLRVAVRPPDLDVVDDLAKHCHLKRKDELALRMIDIPTIVKMAKK